MDIQYIAGSENIVADCFSWIEINSNDFKLLYNEERLRGNSYSISDAKLWS